MLPLSAGHGVNARYNGRMMLAIGTIIRMPNAGEKPALSHIFQNAIIGRISVNIEVKSITSISMFIAGLLLWKYKLVQSLWFAIIRIYGINAIPSFVVERVFSFVSFAGVYFSCRNSFVCYLNQHETDRVIFEIPA